jgi:hypothetical protein
VGKLKFDELDFQPEKKIILKLIFAGYTGSKNPVQNMLIKNPVCQT